MSTVAQVAKTLQHILTEAADQAGRASGFIKRERKLTGASFVQTMTFGWMSNGAASLGELNQAAASVGVAISAQGLNSRFSAEAAECMKQVLEAATREVIQAGQVEVAVLKRFTGVRLMDSSTLNLPDSLADLWAGCGDSQGPTAALKIQVDLNFSTGALEALWLQAGREHDQCQRVQAMVLPAGSLRVADLGYFKLDLLESYAAQGVFWLTRLKIGTGLYDLNHQVIALAEWLSHQADSVVERPILLGQVHHLACRLIAARVPDSVAAQRKRRLRRQARKKGQTVSPARLALAHWTLLVTNVPTERLTAHEALILYAVRWQIELLFKLWKDTNQLDLSRSQNPWRILCEVYAKLLACIIQHWIFLIGFWAYPNRSLTKAAQTIQHFAFALASVCRSKRRLTEVLNTIDSCLAAGCRVNPRHSHPNTYQRLLFCSDLALT